MKRANCFYFDPPWKDAALSVAFRSKLDNDRALHHCGPFGAGSGEMCYGFVLHYPAHALDNGTRSLGC